MTNIKVLQDKLEEVEKAILEAKNDEESLEQKERDLELAKHLRIDIDAKLADLQK